MENQSSLRRVLTFLFSSLFFLFPIQLGKHWWPEWSFVLGRRVDYLSPTLFLTDILLLLIIAGYSVLFGSSTKERHAIETFVRTHQRKVVLLTALCLFFSSVQLFTAFVPILAAITFVRWLSLLLVLGIGIRLAIKRATLIRFFLLGVFFAALLGMTQTIMGRSIGGLFYWFGERTFTLATAGIAKATICIPNWGCPEFLRPYGTFAHPNILGAALGIALLIVLREKISISSVLRMILILFFTVTFLLTGSRTAWASFFIVWLYTRLHGHTKAQWIFVALAVLVFLFFASPLLLHSLQNQESFFVRQQLTNASIHIIEQHWLFGVGLMNFLYALPSFLPSREIFFLQPVHNIYLLFVSETGFLGTGIVLFLLFSFQNVLKKIVRSPTFPFLLFLFLLGLGDHYLLTIEQGRFLVFIVLFFISSSFALQ